MTSSVKSRGCGEVNRTRSSPSTLAAGAQQLRERAAVAQLGAVGVHVLAEQRHLEDALADQRAHLGEDVAGPAVLLHAAQRRHDAERAGVVAADRDRDPGRVRRLAARGQGGREHLELRAPTLDCAFVIRAGGNCITYS